MTRSDRLFYTALFAVVAVCILGVLWAQRTCAQRGGILLRSAFGMECVSRATLLPAVHP